MLCDLPQPIVGPISPVDGVSMALNANMDIRRAGAVSCGILAEVCRTPLALPLIAAAALRYWGDPDSIRYTASLILGVLVSISLLNVTIPYYLNYQQDLPRSTVSDESSVAKDFSRLDSWRIPCFETLLSMRLVK